MGELTCSPNLNPLINNGADMLAAMFKAAEPLVEFFPMIVEQGVIEMQREAERMKKIREESANEFLHRIGVK